MAIALIAVPLAAQTESGVFAPFVSRLAARTENNRIHLSWVDSPDILGPVYIYRSTMPFLDPEPVLDAALAVVPYGEQSFIDETAAIGTVYYFALASDVSGRRFNYPIISTNTISILSVPGIQTGFPAEDPPELAELDDLEYFTDYYTEDYYIESFPEQRIMGPALMRPRVFIADLEPFQITFDDHVLARLVRSSFAARDWEYAKYELISFLAMPRSQETRTRARFYLGQSFYFLQEPKEGLFEFLTIQDRFPMESAEWIQAAYNMMNYNITEY